MPEGGARARIPLPGLLFAGLALALVHGPLVATPPLFDEGPFLAGFSESRGAVLGMQWLPAELALLGSGALAHRLFALLLEAALLALFAGSKLVRESRAPNLALLALAALLVHPWRTESFLRLGQRAQPVSEVLLAVGTAFVAAGPGRAARGCGLLLLAAGASGFPLAVAFAIPFLIAAQGEARRGARAAALALIAGAGLFWIAAPPPAPLASALAGLDRLLRPWTTGLVHAQAGLPWALGGALVLALLFALAAWRRDAAAGAAVAAAALAFAAAPSLRPPRTGLDMLGAGITPEAWLAPLGLLLFSAWRLAAGGAAGRLPLLALAALSFGGGLVHGRRFESEESLVDHALSAEPDQVELRVLEAHLLLQRVGLAPPERVREFAEAAMAAAERALLRRPEDVPAGSLKCLALALSGRLDPARSLCDGMLERTQGDWRVRACRAELESLAGDDLAALSWLRAAADAHPTPLLRARLAGLVDRIYEQIRLDLAQRQWESARSRCERLAATAPQELEARTTYVDTFTLAGDLPRALEECRRLYGERPHERAVVQRLASLCEKLGQEAEAAGFRRLLLSLPASPRGSRR